MSKVRFLINHIYTRMLLSNEVEILALCLVWHIIMEAKWSKCDHFLLKFNLMTI